jgi:large conductance mechanosensitive channel
MKKPKMKNGATAIKRVGGEFKAFAMKGNVIDLAVGVIVGAAFSKIVSSLVNDVAMPIVGMFTGGVDFSKLYIELPRFFGQIDPIQLKIGTFINTVIEFIILAFVVFIFVKAINKLKRKQAEEPATPATATKEEMLLSEIRDILKEQKDK